MKLFTRYFRANLTATLIIFLLASTAFYFLLWFVMIRQVDEDLKIEQREIETYISKYNKLPEPISVKDQRISYEPSPTTKSYRAFVTIPSPDKHEDNSHVHQIATVTACVAPRQLESRSRKGEVFLQLNRARALPELTRDGRSNEGAECE